VAPHRTLLKALGLTQEIEQPLVGVVTASMRSSGHIHLRTMAEAVKPDAERSGTAGVRYHRRLRCIAMDISHEYSLPAESLSPIPSRLWYRRMASMPWVSFPLRQDYPGMLMAAVRLNSLLSCQRRPMLSRTSRK